MIAHVAAAGEGRGRVVLHLAASGRMSDAAIDAALHLADAFQSEIETLFVADEQVLAFAQFPFAREIALTGRRSRNLSPADVETDLGHLAAALHRRVAAMAKRREICCSSRLIRGEPVTALATACAEPGPWNAVVLSGLPGELSPDLVPRLFAEVEGTTGIVIAGGNAGAAPATGPVVALVEDLDDLAALLRSASRLAIPPGAGVRVVLAAKTQEQWAWMDGQARLALGEDAGDVIGPAVTGEDGASAAVQGLNALCPRLVIARFARDLGANLATHPETLAGLRSPVLLLR